MAEWIDPKHAEMVERYKAAQAASGANVWPGRPGAAYRIKTFVTVPQAEQE